MVPILMSQLFEWLHRSEEHPLIKSCVFHYEFEFIHPFSGGNGRIGRLWQSVILCHWKDIFRYIPTESIIRDHQESYYQAIEDSTKDGRITSKYFCKFIINFFNMFQIFPRNIFSIKPFSISIYCQRHQ